MIVALRADNTASGDLFWDDGVSIDTVGNKKFNYIRFSYSETQAKDSVGELRNCAIYWNFNNLRFKKIFQAVLASEFQITSATIPNELEGLKMDSVMIYGMARAPVSVDQGNVAYNPDTKVATLTNLGRLMTSNWQVALNF